MRKKFVLAACAAAVAFAMAGAMAADAPAAALPPASTKKVDYVADVKPILKDRCWSCHGVEKQKGKLRLLYEANPFAFLLEAAGGAATNGEDRILDIVPTKLHQRVPVFLGSRSEVERVTSYHQE